MTVWAPQDQVEDALQVIAGDSALGEEGGNWNNRVDEKSKEKVRLSVSRSSCTCRCSYQLLAAVGGGIRG